MSKIISGKMKIKIEPFKTPEKWNILSNIPDNILVTGLHSAKSVLNRLDLSLISASTQKISQVEPSHLIPTPRAYSSLSPM